MDSLAGNPASPRRLFGLIGILPEKLKKQGKKVGARQAREDVG